MEKIVQIVVSGYQTESADVVENMYALCENGRVAALDITDGYKDAWVALPEIPDGLFQEIPTSQV